MSGGGTNTVQSSQPNDIVAGHLGDLYNGSQGLANLGGPSINTGQVQPFNGNQTNALNSLAALGSGTGADNLTPQQKIAMGIGTNLATGNTGGQMGLSSILNGTNSGVQGLQAAGQANGTLGNTVLGYLANGGGVGNNTLAGIASGSNAGMQGLQSILNGANSGVQGLNSIIHGTNAGTQYLQSTLSPNYTNVATNPNLQAAMNAANYNTNFNFTNDVMPQLASQFSAAGRFGSGAQTQGINQATNNLATQISNTNSGLANQDYMQMLGQQSANAGTLGGLQSGASQALGSLQSGAGQAYGTLAGGASTALNSNLLNASSALNGNMTTANNALTNAQLQAGGALTNSQLAGNAAMPGLTNMGVNNAQLQFGAGSAQQTQQQSQLNAIIAQMNQQANQPYTNMGWLSQILGGTAGIGGQNASTTTNQANPFSTALGAGFLGNSLYSSGAFGAGAGAAAGTAGAFGTPLFTAAIGGGAADTGGMSALMGLGGYMADMAPLAAA